MQTLDRDEVSAYVGVPPEEVYALVADVTRTPQFSREILRCTWLEAQRDGRVVLPVRTGGHGHPHHRVLRGDTADFPGGLVHRRAVVRIA